MDSAQFSQNSRWRTQALRNGEAARHLSNGVWVMYCGRMSTSIVTFHLLKTVSLSTPHSFEGCSSNLIKLKKGWRWVSFYLRWLRYSIGLDNKSQWNRIAISSCSGTAKSTAMTLGFSQHGDTASVLLISVWPDYQSITQRVETHLNVMTFDATSSLCSCSRSFSSRITYRPQTAHLPCFSRTR